MPQERQLVCDLYTMNRIQIFFDARASIYDVIQMRLRIHSLRNGKPNQSGGKKLGS